MDIFYLYNICWFFFVIYIWNIYSTCITLVLRYFYLLLILKYFFFLLIWFFNITYQLKTKCIKLFNFEFGCPKVFHRPNLFMHSKHFKWQEITMLLGIKTTSLNMQSLSEGIELMYAFKTQFNQQEIIISREIVWMNSN